MTKTHWLLSAVVLLCLCFATISMQFVGFDVEDGEEESDLISDGRPRVELSMAEAIEQHEERSRQEFEKNRLVIVQSDGQKVKSRPGAYMRKTTIGVIGDDEAESPGVNKRHDKTVKMHERAKRKSVLQDSRLWSNGDVPYAFDESKKWDNQGYAENFIGKGLSSIEEVSCIKFDKVDPGFSGNHILFGNGAESALGRVGSSDQSLSLNYHQGARSSCLQHGIVVHEILHALGFYHEHVRPDRDDYITIYEDNIKPTKLGEFTKKPTKTNIPYDLGSIMHYGLKDDVKTFRLTNMKIKNEALNFLPGQRVKMSYYDIKTLNLDYKCGDGCTNNCQNDGYPFRNSYGACVCRCPDYLTGAHCEQVITDPGCGGVHILRDIGNYIDINVTATTAKDARTCAWLIKGPSIMRVHFKEFNLRLNKYFNCYHSLEVRFNLLGQEGPKLCGPNIPGDISTKDDFGIHAVLLIFKEVDDVAEGATLHARVIASQPDDPCLSNPCHGSATCIHLHRELFVCKCPAQYTGYTCRDVDTNIRLVADFEKSFDFFQNLDDDDFDWTRKTGTTDTPDTGPSGGYLSETYVYCEASFPCLKGYIARLATPYLPMYTGRCLQFYCHMFGTDKGMGYLKVLVEYENDAPPLVIYNATGNHGNNWTKQSFDIPPCLSRGMIVFQYQRVGKEGDVAIDRVETFPGHCTPITSTTSQKPITSTTVQQPISSTVKLTTRVTESPTTECRCDFEHWGLDKVFCDCFTLSKVAYFKWTQLIHVMVTSLFMTALLS